MAAIGPGPVGTLQRRDTGAQVTFVPWRANGAPLRAVANADAVLMHRHLDDAEGGHAARAALGMLGVEAPATAAMAPSLVNYCTFAASLAGLGDAAACVSRGVAAMLAARSTNPVTFVAPYTTETCDAAAAVLAAATTILSAAARTPAVLQTSDALNPRSGVDEQLSASASMMDARGATLEELLPTWVQPARRWAH